VISSRKM